MSPMRRSGMIHRSMANYFSQPELHVVRRLQPRQFAIELQKNILCQLLGDGAIAQETVSDAEHHRLVFSHKLGKSSSVQCHPINRPVSLACLVRQIRERTASECIIFPDQLCGRKRRMGDDVRRCLDLGLVCAPSLPLRRSNIALPQLSIASQRHF